MKNDVPYEEIMSYHHNMQKKKCYTLQRNYELPLEYVGKYDVPYKEIRSYYYDTQNLRPKICIF